MVVYVLFNKVICHNYILVVLEIFVFIEDN